MKYIIIISSLILCTVYIIQNQPNNIVPISYNIVQKNNNETEIISNNGENYSRDNNTEYSENTESMLATFKGFGAIGKNQEYFEADEAIYFQEEKEREKLISDCMISSGYEYIPSPSIELDPSFTLEDIYAMEISDPNRIYYQTLSDQDKNTYNMILYGIPDPNDPELNYEEMMNNDSCIGRAFRSIPGVYHTANQMRDEVKQMENDIQNDSRLKDVEYKWIDCMSASSGYQYSRRNEIHEQINKAYSLIYDKGLSEISLSTLELAPQLKDIIITSMDRKNLSYDEKVEVEMDSYIRKVSEYRDSCDKKVGYKSVLSEISQKHEIAFIERNKEKLSSR